MILYYTHPSDYKDYTKIDQNVCTMSPSFTEPKTVSNCQEYCCSKCGEYTLIEICFGEDEKPKFCSNCGAKVID